jgi:integrase
VRRSLKRDVLSEWNTRPVRDIRRRDVLELVTRKAKTGATAANRLQAHISMLVAYDVEADWLPTNPAAGLRKRKEQPRDRVLRADELRDLWRYLEADNPIAFSRGAKPETRIEMPPPETGETLRQLFTLLLVCGQRLGETSRMKWADVELDAKRWTIPATETKNRTAHQVPLSEPAVELLKARSEAAHPLGTDVFPGSAESDASAWVWSKRTAAALARATGIPFTAHDLRRTEATMMGELGIEADAIGLVLNHRKTGRHHVALRPLDAGDGEARGSRPVGATPAVDRDGGAREGDAHPGAGVVCQSSRAVRAEFRTWTLDGRGTTPRPARIRRRHGSQSPRRGLTSWAARDRAYRPRGVKAQAYATRATARVAPDATTSLS